MATEKPRSDENDDRVEQEEGADKSDERSDSNAATVEEQSEDSFPASDPPSY